MNIITFNNINYYEADALRTLDKNIKSKYFFGCSKSSRVVINKHNIDSNNYIYVSSNKQKLILSTDEYKKAKLLLLCDWVHIHFSKLNLNTTNVFSQIDNINEELCDENDIILETSIEQPIIVELNESEKFKDNTGKTFDIEVRGEKNVLKCFFKVNDIGIAFEMKNLSKTIIRNHTSYKRGLDYECFNRSVDIVHRSEKQPIKTPKQSLFLTYIGVVKVLFTSRSGNTNIDLFQLWAAKNLFTIQMGEQPEKYKVASKLIGISPSSIKDVFGSNVSKTPCVYLYTVGYANKLLNNTQYNENDLVLKYGRTDDFPRRNEEHVKTFKNEFNTDINLFCFAIIDPKYLSDAESQIRDFFINDKLTYKNYSELIVIDKSRLIQIKKMYGMVQQSYIGCFTELNKQIEEYKLQIKELNYSNNLNNEKHNNKIMLLNETHKNDITLINEKHKSELKDKDFIIQNEKHKILIKNKDIELKDKDIKLLELQLQLALLKK